MEKRIHLQQKVFVLCIDSYLIRSKSQNVYREQQKCILLRTVDELEYQIFAKIAKNQISVLSTFLSSDRSLINHLEHHSIILIQTAGIFLNDAYRDGKVFLRLPHDSATSVRAKPYGSHFMDDPSIKQDDPSHMHDMKQVQVSTSQMPVFSLAQTLRGVQMADLMQWAELRLNPLA